MFRLLRGRCPSVFAPTDSCANPLGLSPPSAAASSRSLGRLPPAPAAHRIFPALSLPNLSPDAWSHATAVPESALACFFPCVIGLPLKGIGSASRFNPRTQLCAGIFSRLQTFLDVQASEFARPPGRSHRCKCSRRAAGTFTSGLNVLRCLCTHRIC